MQIELPDFLLDGSDERTVRIDIACALFARGYWSSGRAAMWVPMDKFDFWEELAKREISRIDEAGALEDVRRALEEPIPERA